MAATWRLSVAVLALLLVVLTFNSGNVGPLRRLQPGVRGGNPGPVNAPPGPAQPNGPPPPPAPPAPPAPPQGNQGGSRVPGTTLPAPRSTPAAAPRAPATSPIPASTTSRRAPATSPTPATTPGARATSKAPLGTTVAAATSLQSTTASVAQQVQQLVNSASDRGHVLGGLVRLAFHDAATYNGVTGGADGCVDLTSSENRGLQSVIDSLAPVVLSAKGVLSRADVWTLAANVAIQIAGGPSLSFQAGRVDSSSCTGQDNLPDAQLGASMMESVFVTRLGFTEAEATSLIGAHVLGKAQTINSGYDGQWVPRNAVWSNQYFVDLVGKVWRQRNLPAFQGQARTQWNGPAGTMMLNSDISLAFDTTSCTSAGGNGGQCRRATHAFSTAVTQFVASNAAFNAVFVTAFTKLTALGTKPGSLKCVQTDCSTPRTQR